MVGKEVTRQGDVFGCVRRGRLNEDRIVWYAEFQGMLAVVDGLAAREPYDHLISLQLGGDPNDPRNLWVEPPSPGHKSGAGPNNPKDAVETHLHTAICHHTVTLTAAQHAIATDWTTAESTLGITRPQ